MECKHCNKILQTKSSLNLHIKTSKKCITLRTSTGTDTDSEKHGCFMCNTIFVRKDVMQRHIKSCLYKHMDRLKCVISEHKSIEELKIDNKHKDSKLTEKDLVINQLKIPHDKIEEFKSKIKSLETNLQSKDEIIIQLTKQLEQKDNTIARITKKQGRVQISDQNVIYVLTTPFLKQSNTYIIGKAKNLTTRLSTYNKSDEHEVVYYRQCKDQHLLVATETVILIRLNEYKVLGNRDRITLPRDKTLEDIIDVINDAIEYIN